MHRDPRIDAMFNRDRTAASFAVFVVWLVYGFTFWMMRDVFAESHILPIMATLGLIVVFLNSAAVVAMIKHYGEDRDSIYGTDIYYLDRAREARRTKGAA
ncbi:hypothetical protein [Methylobacterium gnaphalii]|nr:hypothetical protein [Methylobacterium gnaphalii]GJD68514.1 hypothetical protein MMMDOFMJ_1437 [Methylobacterium gnaphalii]GLS51283.1 hypothetical protein GCM10007885_41380 [Methylobacterium gnaphalii]